MHTVSIDEYIILSLLLQDMQYFYFFTAETAETGHAENENDIVITLYLSKDSQ